MTRDAYGRLARWEDLIMEPLNSPLRDIGMRLVPPHEGMRVLDVGCGTGAQLLRYQRAKCHVYGIDASAAMLARARKRLAPNSDLRHGSAESLPYPDDLFDLVIASLVLHELEAMVRERVMIEMIRVLAPDGRILVTDFHPGPWTVPKGWFYRCLSVIAESVARHRDRSRAFIGSGGMPALAARVGLSIERTRVVSGGNMALYVLCQPAVH